MHPEELLERAEGGFAVGVGHGQPEKLLAAGQVAHSQEVRIESVDEVRRLGEVHRPDAAGGSPAQAVLFVGIVQLPDAAVAFEEFVEFGAWHGGEAVTQQRHAGGRSKFVKEVKDLIALLAGGAQRRPTQGQEGGRVRD